MKGWLKDESTEAYLPHQEGWLWIAYYFGREDIRYNMMKCLALRLNIGNDGKFLLMNGSVDRRRLTLNGKLYSLNLEGSPLPPEVTDTIIRLRRDMIRCLIKFTANFMGGLLNSNMCSPCKELCSLAMYGLMSKRLTERNLWPLLGIKNYNLNPFQLYKSINRALQLNFIAHTPMAKLHTGSCFFMNGWKEETLLKSEYTICKYNVQCNDGETGGNWFQKFMDCAAEEIGNSDCPKDPILGGAPDKFIMEMLELCSIKSS